MRVPVPLVIFLAFAVIGGTWWLTTRKTDFLTPPSEQELAAIRSRVESSQAQPERSGDSAVQPELKKTAANDSQIADSKPPAIELGDIDSPPTLEAYSERSLDGHAKLAELAGLLEREGEFQRSLLAWERSIDLTKPDPAQIATSIAAIRRLRPTLPDWNTDRSAAIPVVLHAGTGPALADALRPVLEQAARELTNASAGILNVTSNLAIGKRATSKGPVPVAVWLAGPAKESVSTDVLSFTVASKDTLRVEIDRIAFQLISSHLKRVEQMTPPADLLENETALHALQSHISRLAWREFGKSLNSAPAASQ